MMMTTMTRLMMMMTIKIAMTLIMLLMMKKMIMVRLMMIVTVKMTIIPLLSPLSRYTGKGSQTLVNNVKLLMSKIVLIAVLGSAITT